MLPDPGLPETWKAIAEAAEASVGVTYLKMYCDHGKVPPEGCKACYAEDPYNWIPRPSWAERNIRNIKKRGL